MQREACRYELVTFNLSDSFRSSCRQAETEMRAGIAVRVEVTSSHKGELVIDLDPKPAVFDALHAR